MMRCTTLTVGPAPPPPPPPPPPPAALRVTDIRVSPPEVDVNQSVTIEVTVSNTGGAPGSATVRVTADGLEIRSFDTGTIEPGASETLSLDWTPPRAGTFRICAEVAPVIMR